MSEGEADELADTFFDSFRGGSKVFVDGISLPGTPEWKRQGCRAHRHLPRDITEAFDLQ